MNYRKHASGLVIIILTIISLLSAAPSDLDNTINELYESLLQREYAGPISFPDHQVERKAQRSPSLRLRFGRSDPDILQSTINKRWLGDVNQKPIRSPSLRLRFGRRSDPMMLIHGIDMLNNDYDDGNNFQRQERKPSGRLRWGRSVQNNNGITMSDDENQRTRRSMDNLEIAPESESLMALLNALKELDDNSSEFNREIRKPAPLRLRWGRSTGNADNTMNEHPKTRNSNTDIQNSTESSSLLSLLSTIKG